MTNWYSIFYWLTVADGVKQFFDTSSNIFTAAAVIGVAGYIIGSLCTSSNSDYPDHSDYKISVIWQKAFKTIAIVATIFSMLTWMGWIFTPTKKDALIIIAGGTVANFVTQDSSAKQVPHEVMELLRVKIKEEISETSLKDVVENKVDTLADKSTEELKAIIRNKK